jgi:hypothetical protein
VDINQVLTGEMSDFQKKDWLVKDFLLYSALPALCGIHLQQREPYEN